jgi:hypothetical protein
MTSKEKKDMSMKKKTESSELKYQDRNLEGCSC